MINHNDRLTNNENLNISILLPPYYTLNYNHIKFNTKRLKPQNAEVKN